MTHSSQIQKHTRTQIQKYTNTHKYKNLYPQDYEHSVHEKYHAQCFLLSEGTLFQDEKGQQFEKWSANHGKSFVQKPACHEINPLTRLLETPASWQRPQGTKPFFITRLFHDDDDDVDDDDCEDDDDDDDDAQDSLGHKDFVH